MKGIPLQLVTLVLENGNQGIFVGLPLLPTPSSNAKVNNISEIWFSDVRNLPESLSLDELVGLVEAQLCQCNGQTH